MKYFSKLTAIAVAVVMCQMIVHAQATSDNPTKHKPTMRTERAHVEFLLGSFTTEVSIPPGPSMPKAAPGKGTSAITWSLDSMFLSIEEESVNEILGHYKGHGMLGFDATMGEFVLSMFNNFGDHPTYHGNIVGDTLVLQTKVAAPGHPFDQKLLWYKDGGTVRLIVLNDFGKGFTPALEETETPASPNSK